MVGSRCRCSEREAFGRKASGEGEARGPAERRWRQAAPRGLLWTRRAPGDGRAAGRKTSTVSNIFWQEDTDSNANVLSRACRQQSWDDMSQRSQTARDICLLA